jgi:hypothetical protein
VCLQSDDVDTHPVRLHYHVHFHLHWMFHYLELNTKPNVHD